MAFKETQADAGSWTGTVARTRMMTRSATKTDLAFRESDREVSYTPGEAANAQSHWALPTVNAA